MHLVHDGATLVLLHEFPDDPIERRTVEKDVEVQNLELFDCLQDWPDGFDAPEVVLGRCPDARNLLRLFSSSKECRAARFEVLAGNPFVADTWAKYAELISTQSPA